MIINLAYILSLAACSTEGVAEFSTQQLDVIQRFAPHPTALEESNQWSGNPSAIAFGRSLFASEQLSPDAIACSSCHQEDQGLSDGLPLSFGVSQTARHAPTLWESGTHRWYNWDGSCDSLWCQAIGPLEKASEMNATRVGIAQQINVSEALSVKYSALFGALPDTSNWPQNAKPATPTNEQEFLNEDDEQSNIAWQSMTATEQAQSTEVLVNVAKSIGAFVETLHAPATGFDVFVETFQEAPETALDTLSESQRLGLFLFTDSARCHLCHSGPGLTDLEFHNIGLGPASVSDELDLGRYTGIDSLRANPFNSAGIWSDSPNGERAQRIDRLWQTTEQLGQFKTPTLRGLKHTAPYMHAGQFEDLESVLHFYNSLDENPMYGHREEILLPANWNEEELEGLLAFLLFISGD